MAPKYVLAKDITNKSGGNGKGGGKKRKGNILPPSAIVRMLSNYRGACNGLKACMPDIRHKKEDNFKTITNKKIITL